MEKKLKIPNVGDKVLLPLLCRTALACMLWPHGAQLLLGIFGGQGYEASMSFFSSKGHSQVSAFTVIFLQFFGSLLIAIGLYTRVTSVAVCIMVLYISIPHQLQHGKVISWEGALGKEGTGYHLILMIISLWLAWLGPGRISLDVFYSKEYWAMKE